MHNLPHVRRGTRTNGSHVGEEPKVDLKKLLRALQAVREGDFSVRLPSDQTGLAGKVADTFNEIVSCQPAHGRELERAGQVVGKEGKTRHRVIERAHARAPGARWKPRSTR